MLMFQLALTFLQMKNKPIMEVFVIFGRKAKEILNDGMSMRLETSFLYMYSIEATILKQSTQTAKFERLRPENNFSILTCQSS